MSAPFSTEQEARIRAIVREELEAYDQAGAEAVRESWSTMLACVTRRRLQEERRP